MEMGKITGKSMISEHFGILQLWEFFASPSGKMHPKRTMESLKKYQVFKQPNYT